jgi:hypothetical protein
LVQRLADFAGEDGFKTDLQGDAPLGGFDQVEPPLARLDLRDERLRFVQKLRQISLGQPALDSGLPQQRDELDVEGFVRSRHLVRVRHPISGSARPTVGLSRSPPKNTGISRGRRFEPKIAYIEIMWRTS